MWSWRAGSSLEGYYERERGWEGGKRSCEGDWDCYSWQKRNTRGSRNRQRCQGNTKQVEDKAPAWWSGTDKWGGEDKNKEEETGWGGQSRKQQTLHLPRALCFLKHSYLFACKPSPKPPIPLSNPWAQSLLPLQFWSTKMSNHFF